MNKITRIQYWQLQRDIQANKWLSQVGSLRFSSQGCGKNFKAFYKDDNGKIWVKVDRDGYHADPTLAVLIPLP